MANIKLWVWVVPAIIIFFYVALVLRPLKAHNQTLFLEISRKESMPYSERLLDSIQLAQHKNALQLENINGLIVKNIIRNVGEDSLSQSFRQMLLDEGAELKKFNFNLEAMGRLQRLQFQLSGESDYESLLNILVKLENEFSFMKLSGINIRKQKDLLHFSLTAIAFIEPFTKAGS